MKFKNQFNSSKYIFGQVVQEFISNQRRNMNRGIYGLAITLLGWFVASVELAMASPSAKQLEEAQTISEVNDVILRRHVVISGYEKFKKAVYREPFSNGVYIVNGDTPIANERELREFYEKELSGGWKSTVFGLNLSVASQELVADSPQGKIVAWDSITKRNLTYCVSASFNERYSTVVSAMLEAAKAWESASDVKFHHSSWLDSLCNEKTTDVIFDVRPVNVHGQYLARAFFPRFSRSQRNLLIDETALTLKPGKLTLVGVLRHELGHVLSYRHEQTRPEAGKCFEDNNWKPLTDYDAFSVMHYPQCNGLGDWSLVLTDDDKKGAACLYGPVPNSFFDQSQCKAI
jgi:Matrixin